MFISHTVNYINPLTPALTPPAPKEKEMDFTEQKKKRTRYFLFSPAEKALKWAYFRPKLRISRHIPHELCIQHAELVLIKPNEITESTLTSAFFLF